MTAKKKPATKKQKQRHRCFVVMPFREKVEIDGKTIDFDVTYEHFIKPLVEKELRMECKRCDEIDEAGWIHSKMFRHIHEADVVIVDITTLNPNVFYELGVRHTLAKKVTVLIKRASTTTPFNLSGFNVIEYGIDFDGPSGKEEIKEAIRNGLKAKETDSPVHEVLEIKVGPDPIPVDRQEIHDFVLAKPPGKIIGVITGDILDIKNVDAWVNSENTHMMMARILERSVSSAIRYKAQVKKGGKVVEDLQTQLDKNTRGVPVAAGEVVVTGAGALEDSHHVKRIFHAAAGSGQPMRGLEPIPDVKPCVRNALDRAEQEKDVEIRSIVFPLLGTGQARGDLEVKAWELINTAVSYLEENPNCRLDKVYFVAWSKRERDACLAVLNAADNLKRTD